MRQINFKGYGKWVLLNQSVREEHPDGLDLEIIIDKSEAGKTPKGGRDEIYLGL